MCRLKVLVLVQKGQWVKTYRMEDCSPSQWTLDQVSVVTRNFSTRKTNLKAIFLSVPKSLEARTPTSYEAGLLLTLTEYLPI